MTEFDNITPCGGSCTGCSHYIKGDCKGCRENGGKCVTMWKDGCAIYSCCVRHDAFFCGLCSEFPCEWLKNKISEWDKNGIDRLKTLADEFNKENTHGKAGL